MPLLRVDTKEISKAAHDIATRNEKWLGTLWSINLKALDRMKITAQQSFRDSIVRPQESGSRPERRETGKFTFGAKSGGSLIGVHIHEPQKHVYGFGYPNMERADAATNYVWRTLEFGLGAYKDKDPQAPIGDFRMPKFFEWEHSLIERRTPVRLPKGVSRFYYTGEKRRTRKMRQPLSNMGAGALVPLSRETNVHRNSGIHPKRFIRDSFETVKYVVEREYLEKLTKFFDTSR